jgi:hypothetical protein
MTTTTKQIVLFLFQLTHLFLFFTSTNEVAKYANGIIIIVCMVGIFILSEFKESK